MQQQLFGLNTVKTIDYLGYSKEHGCYVFGDLAVRGGVLEATQIWAINELEPIQARLAQVNDWLVDEVVSFRPFEIPSQG